MNPSLREFFNEEKKRIFTPDPFFHTRVMARINETRREAEIGIWDVIPTSSRPVFGLALVLMLAFLAIQSFMPHMPERGFIDAVLESESTPGEVFLYTGAEVPADQELLNQLMGFEEQK
jgi:hypothetical protein